MSSQAEMKMSASRGHNRGGGDVEMVPSGSVKASANRSDDGESWNIGMSEKDGSLNTSRSSPRSFLAGRSSEEQIDIYGIHMISIPVIIIATIAVGGALIFLKEILVPFVVAFFFVNLLRPLIKLLTTPMPCCCPSLAREIEYREKLYMKKDDEKVEITRLLPSGGLQSSSRCVTPGREGKGSVIRCPHWLAVLLSLVIVCGMLTLLVISLASTMKGITSVKPFEIEEAILQSSNSTFAWLKDNFDIDGETILKQFVEEIKISEMVQYVINTIMQSMLDTLMVLLIVLYLLFEESFGDNRTEDGSFKQKIDAQIQQYIALKTLVSIFIGVAVYLILGPLLHVDLALLLGVMTFLLNFIPNLGAFFATFVTPFIMLLDKNNYSSADYILAVALPTACHTVVGNVVEPALFGKSLEIHPIIVLLALAFWYALWGISGAILAVPITAVLRIAVAETNHPYAKFLHNILEGRLPRGWSKSFGEQSHIHSV